MANLWILAILAAFVQISYARDPVEAINVNIREQLNLFDKFQKESDSAKFADELKKLVELTEGALRVESAEEKNKILSDAPSKFSPKFNEWITTKLEEAKVNDDIKGAIEFFNSLLTSHAEHEAEIKKTVGTLETLLKETNLKQKEENFLSLDNTFSPDFQKFLKESNLPSVNRRLQATTEFFDNLLQDKQIKFAKEIAAMKAKTEAALDNKVSIDDKFKVLHEITFTDNEELNEFLHKKNIELS